VLSNVFETAAPLKIIRSPCNLREPSVLKVESESATSWLVCRDTPNFVQETLFSKPVEFIMSSQTYLSCRILYTSWIFTHCHHHLLHKRLLPKAKTLVPSVESNKLCLEHRIPKDLKPRTLISLHATKASRIRLIHSRKRDLVSRNLGHVRVADRNGEIRQYSRARVDEATDLRIVLRALDLRVVCLGDLLVDEQKRSACVGNGVGCSEVLEDLVANGKFRRRELPESSLGFDGDPDHFALEFGSVDFAELVDTGAIGVEVGGEDGQVEAAHDVVEEGFGGRLLGAIVDGVEVGKGKADEAVGVGVLNEGLGDVVGELDGLIVDRYAANGYFVGTDNTCSS
jgi:hypothetical protein